MIALAAMNLLLFTHEDEAQIRQCMNDIQARMEQPWQVDEYHFMLNMVIGVVQYSGEGGSHLSAWLTPSNMPSHRRNQGKYGQICYCDKEMLEKLERRRKVIQVLKRKLDDERFSNVLPADLFS